ncbi:MAG: DUF5706 domain-containing protein [Thiohalocapsa sp.]|jgi:hypothetical protein
MEQEKDLGELFDNVGSRESVNFMLRTVQQNYVQLTLLAEHKANIIVGVTMIVFTLTLGNFSRDIPFSLLALSIPMFASATFAIFALLPHLHNSHAEHIEDIGANPLFFSFFSRMGQEQYMEEMHKLLGEDRLIYQAIITDIFAHGAVLRRKFHYLSWSYRVLLWGFGACFVALLFEVSYRLGWIA